MNEVKIIDVGRAALPLLNVTTKMIWEVSLSRLGGCKLPRGYGRSKRFELNPFNKNISKEVNSYEENTYSYTKSFRY